MAGAKGVWNIAAMAEQYGPLFKLQLLTSVVVVLTDPHTISRVARKTGEQLPFTFYDGAMMAAKEQRHCHCTLLLFGGAERPTDLQPSGTQDRSAVTVVHFFNGS
jgi:hypothetical protein